MPMLQGKRLRPIAVSTASRIAALPDVPTVAESGVPGFDYATWYGLAVPAGTSAEIVTGLNAEVGRIVELPDVKTSLDRQGMVARAGSPDEFAQVIVRTIDQTATLIEAAGLELR